MTGRRLETLLAVYDQPEPWKADHDDALDCFAVEEGIKIGIMALRLVIGLEADWQSRILDGTLGFDEDLDRQLDEFYRRWIEISVRHRDAIERLSQNGFHVKGSEEFRLNLEEAIGILDSRAMELTLPPAEALLPLAKGTNPRPERYGK